LPERPRTDFVVQILEIRSMIAKRWLMSPASRKTFIFSYPNLKKRKKILGEFSRLTIKRLSSGEIALHTRTPSEGSVDFASRKYTEENTPA
jgi:hypothetical protein